MRTPHEPHTFLAELKGRGRMTTEQLQAFLTLAQEKRFVTAARRLGMSQSGLSRQVQSLERELGTRLLVRTPRGVVLTDAGERYLVHAQRALDALRRGASELETLTTRASGLVALGTLPTVGAYLLPELLPRFHARYPEVRLRLVEQISEGLEDLVAKGELDLAVLNLPVRRVDLVQQKLWTEDFVLAVPRGHRLAQTRRPVALREVLGEPLIVVPNVAGTRALEAAAEAAGEPLNIVLETDNPESMRRMVERGLGIALLPSLMTRQRIGRGFEVVEVGQGGVRRQVALLHRGETYLNAAARALKEFLGEALPSFFVPGERKVS
jgi:LysR family transcriptional regulator, transcription activator of glutamate synthase operon